MTFNLAIFEAELALHFIPTESLPKRAQDALEAGFDGPHVVRMAILNPTSFREIDQTLPKMVDELGCRSIGPEVAANRLAVVRAEYLLESGDGPLPSLQYFFMLAQCARYPAELSELAFLDETLDPLDGDQEKNRSRIHKALVDFLSASSLLPTAN